MIILSINRLFIRLCTTYLQMHTISLIQKYIQ